MSPVPEPADNHQSSIDELEIGNHVVNIIATGSSSEEEETIINENEGYQPLPQGPDNLEEEEEAIDYSSLSGILSALNTHGPNVITDDESLQAVSSNNNNVSSSTSNHLSEGSSLQTLPESAKMENVYAKEQAELWNSTNKGNEIKIDEGKEKEIRSLMSKITLPSSAIPQWAKELSEEEWKNQISSRIFGSNLAKNDQS